MNISAEVEEKSRRYPAIPQSQLKKMITKRTEEREYAQINQEMREESSRFIREDLSLSIQFKVVLMGKSGSGKSSVGNLLLGEDMFQVNKSSAPIRGGMVQKSKLVRCQDLPPLYLRIIEVPGQYEYAAEYPRIIQQVSGAFDMTIHAFLWVINFENKVLNRDIQAVRDFMAMGGDKLLEHTMIVLTHGQRLEDDQRLKTALNEEFVNPKNELTKLCNKIMEGRRTAVETVHTKGAEDVQQQSLLHRIFGAFGCKPPYVCRGPDTFCSFLFGHSFDAFSKALFEAIGTETTHRFV